MTKTGQLDFTAKARSSHPVQSHIAAARKNESGTLPADRFIVLYTILSCPNCTAKQLDVKYPNLLGGKAHRRAADLERMGLITRDKSGREMRLYITELGRRKLEELKNGNNSNY